MAKPKQRSYESVVAKFSRPASPPPAGRMALIDACRTGDLRRVQALLEQYGTDDEDGLYTAMEHAVANGHLPIVKYLNHAAKIPLLIRHGVAAAANGHLSVVEYLHRNGADIYANNEIAWAYSIQNGHLPVVEYFHRNGVDIHAKNESALRSAARNGHLPVVEYLHRNGADIRTNNDMALRYAALEGHLPVVEYLHRNGVDIHTVPSDTLRDIARNGHLPVIEYFHRNDADIHANNEAALQAAAIAGHLPVVEYLHRNGADFNAIRTDLMKAIISSEPFPVIDYYHRHGGRRLNEEQERRLQNWRFWNERHGICPEGLHQFSPFFFRDKTFTSVASMLKKEGYASRYGNPYAYHASSLFGTEDRVLNYLERWGAGGKQPLHDLIQNIQLPHQGRFNITAWGDAVLKHGPKMARLVKFAGDLPEPIRDGKRQWSYRLTREAVASKAYENGGDHPSLAALCFSLDWSEDQFNQALSMAKKYQQDSNGDVKPNAHIPDIEIDGAAFGKPAHRFYKLPPGDPRGLLLGEFTDCCQHLAGEGAVCAAHGYLSPHGGFYVVADKAEDEIVAQSWAWRGEEGELVLDSLESLRGHMQPAQWKPLCDEFAKKAGAPVNIGIGGATPDLDYPHAQKSATPLDYGGYRDSHQQYKVTP